MYVCVYVYTVMTQQFVTGIASMTDLQNQIREYARIAGLVFQVCMCMCVYVYIHI